MNYKSFSLFVIMQFFRPGTTLTGGFDYNDTRQWSENYPICREKFQSPIDLRLQQVRRVGTDVSLKWNGYDNVPMKMTLLNIGHTIALTGVWPSNRTPYIQGGPLVNEYVFEGLHFHWGPNNSVGCEHTVHGHSFPLEMHMVHYNRKYKTYTNASNFRDGLAVVGVFFDIIDSTGSQGLIHVLGGAVGVKKPGAKIELDPFALDSFDLIRASYQLCTYSGSLTTPPCSQIVTWIIPINTLKTTGRQMELFRNIELDHGGTHNYRPTQPINGRNIYVMTQWSKFYDTEVYKVVGK